MIDAKLLFTGMSSGVLAKQTIPVTASTTTGSTDYIDFGNAIANLRTIGVGTPLYLVVINKSAADLATGSLQFALQSDSATNFATSLKTHAASQVMATWKIGESVVIPIPPDDLQRYVRMAAINESTALGAAVDVQAFITDKPQQWLALPDGI